MVVDAQSRKMSLYILVGSEDAFCPGDRPLRYPVTLSLSTSLSALLKTHSERTHSVHMFKFPVLLTEILTKTSSHSAAYSVCLFRLSTVFPSAPFYNLSFRDDHTRITPILLSLPSFTGIHLIFSLIVFCLQDVMSIQELCVLSMICSMNYVIVS